jgi:hypothetical protein
MENTTEADLLNMIQENKNKKIPLPIKEVFLPMMGMLLLILFIIIVTGHHG